MGKAAVLVAIEGISGGGKSTLIEDLSDLLAKQNIPCEIYCWNSTKILKKMTERRVKKQKLRATELGLYQFLSFIFEYLFILKPKLKKKKVIICDRFFDSGLIREQVNNSKIKYFSFVSQVTSVIDLRIFLDVPPEIARERIKERGKPLLYFVNGKLNPKNEELNYLSKTYSHYKKMYKTIDDEFIIFKEPESCSLEEIEAVVTKLVKEKINV